MIVYLAADHRGFDLKSLLKEYLMVKDYEIIDCGNNVFDQEDDYPDYVAALADKIKLDSEGRGIVICGSGIGVTICANRFAAIRCALALNEQQIIKGRTDDNINVLALAGDYTDSETAKKLVLAFLQTPYNPLPRFERRLQKINKLCK